MAPTPGPILETQSQIGTEKTDAGFLMSPRNNSLTVTNPKGLLNMPGQNNCFLNSAVQVLWHLDIFRRSFRELSGHACMAESCIFCALKELFTQFQYSQESALPPDALRHALARTFCDQRRFQLGFMDDAAECFENILLRIHVHIANQEHEDMCGDQHCIPHQKFAMTIVEQPICSNCGTTSEPLPFSQMVHYVTTSALCSKALELHKQGVAPPSSFGTLLQLAGDVGEVRKCSSNCGSKINMKKTLMNHPEIVSIGLVWDSECSSAQHITDVFHCIGMCLRLKDMFHAMYDCEWADNTYHELVGVVTYYGKHYSTFFFHTKLRVWIYFDDAAVREIGPSWDSVVEKCQKGRFQPLLLLFANPNGTALSPSSTNHDMPLHHLPFQSSSTKLASMKQVIIQKYLSFQNKWPNDFARPSYKHFRERPNSYEPQLQRHEVQAYPVQSMTPDLSNRNLVMSSKPYNTNTNVPVYSNASALGIPIPSTNYANGNNPNSVSLPNHIYSNVHIPNFPPQNLAESLPQIQTASKGNDACLPPLHNSRYSSRGNSLLYNENPDVLQYKPKDVSDAKDSDSAFTEEDPENETYISRKTVENVLNLQRHMTISRSYSHSSVGNRNSSSSLESFDNMHCTKLNNNSVISDQTNFSRRRDSKDSGHWTGDRNSSSSSTSTENPFLTVFAAKRLMLGMNSSGAKSQLPDYGNTNTSDHGYDSYSVSSSDSYPSITNSPVKLDPRLTQIPEDWSTQEGCADLDSKLKMITEECGPPDCDKLCAEADLLLAKSHEKEKEGDLVMAALLSDSAAARARTAMDAPYNNSRSLVSAKMKHSTCVMRSSCLYRRLKENESDERRKMKGHHSRQSSRDSTHSRHSRQGSKDNSNAKQSAKEIGSQVFEDLENFGKNIEIYGTLPKKGSKKKTSTSTLTSKAKDDEVYKDFLDKQRKNTLGTPNSEHASKNSKPTHTSETTKTKASEKSAKNNSVDAATKTALRKKSDSGTSKDESRQSSPLKKGKQKQSIEQSYFVMFPSHDSAPNDTDPSSRDLLSPLSSPDKKQHRIKRKLMGGFMKRKNRSLPDLRADEELSDDFERSVDDAAISIPSTLQLPNGTLKKLEKLADAGAGAMSRGFHQPHHAFVKKDLTQRPLLMKVNPPNIQCSAINGSASKLTHTLPSLPKKHGESKPRNEAHFIPDKPSKIPYMASLNKPDIPPHPTHHLHPLKTDAKLPQTSITQKVSSIPVLSQQTPIKNEVSIDNSSERNVATTRTSSSNDELPPPSNPFLAEIQAKRKQIIDTKSNGQPKKEIRPKLQPINKNLPSHLPKLASGNSTEGTSWLKELQSKQMQMKHKQLDMPTSILAQLTNPEILKEKARSNNSVISKQSTPLNAANTQQNTSEKSCELSTEMDASSKAKIGEKKSPGSVKDLASKFEKILIKPKEPAGSSNEKSVTSSENNKNQSTLKLIRQHSVTETACDPIESKLTEAEKTNDSHRGVMQLPPASLPEQRAAHTNVSVGSIQRPQQPPDYETAMQRLELIRTHPHTAPISLKYSESDKLPPAPRSPSTPALSDPPKKKSGPKKTVTFSDEVVLVACAEFDDSGFFTNPLLERVYQKHIESGGTEISHFSNVGNHARSTEHLETMQEMQNRLENVEHYENTRNDSNELIPCHLCHNKYISSSMTYCTDCAFYMSRYQQ